MLGLPDKWGKTFQVIRPMQSEFPQHHVHSPLFFSPAQSCQGLPCVLLMSSQVMVSSLSALASSHALSCGKNTLHLFFPIPQFASLTAPHTAQSHTVSPRGPLYVSHFRYEALLPSEIPSTAPYLQFYKILL